MELIVSAGVCVALSVLLLVIAVAIGDAFR